MAKFSRSDIRNFFRDTITEMYDEPSAEEIRRSPRRRRAMNPSPAVNVRRPTEDEFGNMTTSRKLGRRQIREMIEEAMKAMKVGYDGRSETYGAGLHGADLEYMGDMPYAVDYDESLSAMPGRDDDVDPDSLSADDELGAAEGRMNAFGDLFLMSIEHPERVMPEIQSRADAAGMAPFDFLVSQGMSRIAASNIMAALGKFDQAPEGMTFG